MMRKKIVSLCMALALCLGLLPATALAAAEGAPNNLYVGNQNVKSGEATTFWTTDSSTGKLTQYTENEDAWNVKYDPNSATLTLKNATIEGGYDDVNTSGAGIYAASSSGPVSLNIVLEGENKVSGWYGINVSSGGAASLSISGSGSLTVSATATNGIGIFVQAQSGNANLAINGANVNAVVTENNGRGVELSTGQAGNPNLTIEVKGGSLQASGQPNGIIFFTNKNNTQANANLKVSGNAMVKTSGITTEADGSGSQGAVLTTEAGTGETGGIVFDGSAGTVYGTVELQNDLTISEGETLTIGDGASLTVPDGKTLTNNGTVTTTGSGSLTNSGTINNSGTLPDNIQGSAPPKITTPSLLYGEVDKNYSQPLAADNNPTSWSVTNGTLPNGLTLENGTISGIPTAAGTSTFTVKAENTAGSDSKELTLTINPAPVLVTSVALNKSELSLYTGQSEILTATVQPSNATNQNVTWSSDKPDVATVDAAGKVTAVGAGTATITVTTADGNHTATCTVTVTRPYIPPANPNYRITVEATQGGTVTADPTAAKAGTTVTLTPVPHRGYQVGTVAVTDRFGDAVAVTEQADGTYTFTMPNGQVTVTVTFAEAPLPFHDVTEGDWFYDAVRYAYENGLMDGVGDSLFAPNSDTTRAQLVTILYRLEGEPEVSGTSGFTDVAADTWYTDAVAWAAANGIVNGVSETEFAPGKDITREQLATILFRYAEAKGYDVSARADLSAYPDADQIQSYAAESVAWAVAEGLIQGFEDNTLRPAGNATRAQIATILMRFCQTVAQ